MQGVRYRALGILAEALVGTRGLPVVPKALGMVGQQRGFEEEVQGEVQEQENGREGGSVPEFAITRVSPSARWRLPSKQVR